MLALCGCAAFVIIITTWSLAARPQILLRAFAILLGISPVILEVVVFQRRALAIIPGPTPHCLRCGYPADVPAPRCPECGVVRTDRTVVLGTPRFLPADTAHALWGMSLFGVVLVAGMVVWALPF